MSSFDQFEKLFQGIPDDQKIEYKLIQPNTGEILSKVGTKKEIKDLKDKGYDVFIEKDLSDNIKAVNAWLDRHGHTLLVWVVGGIGLWLFLDGLIGLL